MSYLSLLDQSAEATEPDATAVRKARTLNQKTVDSSIIQLLRLRVTL